VNQLGDAPRGEPEKKRGKNEMVDATNVMLVAIAAAEAAPNRRALECVGPSHPRSDGLPRSLGRDPVTTRVPARVSRNA
jgi:hypothetical protein